MQCVQKLAIRDCNCTLPFFVSLFDNLATTCDNKEKLNCSLSAYYRVYMVDNFLQDECLPQCPLECKSAKFNYDYSFNELLGEAYVEKIKENANLSGDFIQRNIGDLNTIKASVVSLKIFYESLAYRVTSESPQMDVTSLVANIGGNLGLFLGVSLFSLSEIVTVLVEIISILKSNVKKNDGRIK